MALREANMTAAEKQARADETRRGQKLLARIVPENDPDWRPQENPNLAFYRQQIPPVVRGDSKVAYLVFSQIASMSFLANTRIYWSGNFRSGTV